MKKFGLLILAAVVGIGAWLLSKQKKVEAGLPGETVLTPVEKADAILANPDVAIARHQQYISNHPSAEDAISQADEQILSGAATREDVLRFETELSIYNQYVAAGGTKNFEDFMISDYGQMPIEYKEQILAARATAADAQVAEFAFATPEYEKEYIEKYAGWDLKAAYARAHPEEDRPEMTIAELEAWAKATSEPVPREIAITIEDDFTGTLEQTTILKEALHEEQYHEALDAIMDKAADMANPGENVVWSPEEGYHVVSEEEAALLYKPEQMWLA